MNKFDTQKRGNHIRHLGVESAIKVPINSKIYNGKIVATNCGKFLRRYFSADDCSYFYTDGNIYSTPCATCLPEDLAGISQKAEAASK